MRPEIEQAIQVLREKIRAKEEEAVKLKKVVNDFYADENEPPPYADVAIDSSASLVALRSDLFYGNTIAEAAQIYLEMRKASGRGSAPVNEIYNALKSGGYKFDTANEENAKNGLRISLRKNSTIFHQLPGGDYGLCIWYGVKGRNEEANHARKRGTKHRHRPTAPRTQVQQAKNEPEAGQNGTDTKDSNRRQIGIATNGGVITVGQLEDRVREKNRRMGDIVKHFGVDEATVTKMLEPASKVYLADRGWLRIRE
jgi:hypothetical protein